MTVVDASVIVEALTAETALGSVARQRLAESTSLHAPHLIDAEVTHALRGLARSGKIEHGLATTAVHQLSDLPITRYPHQPFLDRIWELRENVSSYDACYVSLAEAVEAPLLTTDMALARLQNIGCEVMLLA
jgi:predicted nucleic acid-binding protein